MCLVVAVIVVRLVTIVYSRIVLMLYYIFYDTAVSLMCLVVAVIGVRLVTIVTRGVCPVVVTRMARPRESVTRDLPSVSARCKIIFLVHSINIPEKSMRSLEYCSKCSRVFSN